jgi:hypothetical protein
MPDYDAAFPVGTRVRVADRAALDAFLISWRYHHPIGPEQVECAGREAIVRAVGYYHGGAPLYELNEVPGTWHEELLARAG